MRRGSGFSSTEKSKTVALIFQNIEFLILSSLTE
jgi:hypothetical protein